MCKKIVLMFLIIAMVSCTFFSGNSFAVKDAKPAADGAGSGGTSSNYNTEAFEKGDSGDAGTSIENVAGALLYIIKVIAIGIGLIMLTVLAMKYMLSSAQERASIKQSAVVYVVGACVLFGAAGILNIIEKFATNNLK